MIAKNISFLRVTLLDLLIFPTQFPKEDVFGDLKIFHINKGGFLCQARHINERYMGGGENRHITLLLCNTLLVGLEKIDPIRLLLSWKEKTPP